VGSNENISDTSKLNIVKRKGIGTYVNDEYAMRRFVLFGVVWSEIPECEVIISFFGAVGYLPPSSHRHPDIRKNSYICFYIGPIIP